MPNRDAWQKATYLYSLISNELKASTCIIQSQVYLFQIHDLGIIYGVFSFKVSPVKWCLSTQVDFNTRMIWNWLFHSFSMPINMLKVFGLMSAAIGLHTAVRWPAATNTSPMAFACWDDTETTVTRIRNQFQVSRCPHLCMIQNVRNRHPHLFSSREGLLWKIVYYVNPFVHSTTGTVRYSTSSFMCKGV